MSPGFSQLVPIAQSPDYRYQLRLTLDGEIEGVPVGFRVGLWEGEGDGGRVCRRVGVGVGLVVEGDELGGWVGLREGVLEGRSVGVDEGPAVEG